MKRFILILSFMAIMFQAEAQTPLNVMSFNIRYNTPNDSLNAWPYRKDKAASQILFHQAQLVGIQEALHGQILDLLERMPSYNSGRNIALPDKDHNR